MLNRRFAIYNKLELMFFDHWRLRHKVDHLSIYNDKGVAWAKHTDEEARVERERRVAEIRALVERIGRGNLPASFVSALDSGAVADDVTGRYAAMLKRGCNEL